MRFSLWLGCLLVCLLTYQARAESPDDVISRQLISKGILDPKSKVPPMEQIQKYCAPGATAEAKKLCMAMGQYYATLDKLGQLRRGIMDVYTSDKMYFADYQKYSTDLKMMMKRNAAPQDVVFAISEQCASKPKGEAWNSFQVADAGIVTISQNVKSKRADFEALIRKFLPRCADPMKEMEIVSLAWLPGMTNIDVWYVNHSGKSLKQLQRGLEAPRL